MFKHEIYTLPNGIRVVHRHTTMTELVHVGIMINAGSRDENDVNNGIAHFIEHTVFKGTTKRKAHHILTMIEKVGGELNAFTTREKTCFYASCLKQYADRAIELLADITLSATFPEKEVEREKKVVLDEIEMYDDSPDESIYDEFYGHIFKSHPLGYNILGTRETVAAFTQEMIADFRRTQHTTDNMILSIVGDISFEKGRRLAEKFMGHVPASEKQGERQAPPPYQPFEVKLTKDFTQTHCMMGMPAYSKHESKRFGLSLINNILGGSGMSARLSMAVREKHGLTYHISSHYGSYRDTGVFSIYFACDKKYLAKCRQLIEKELKKMREVKLTTRQLKESKMQLLGQIALIEENQSVHMQSQARSLLDYGELHTFKDYLQEVDKVTAEDVLEISNEIFASERMSALVYESE